MIDYIITRIYNYSDQFVISLLYKWILFFLYFLYFKKNKIKF